MEPKVSYLNQIQWIITGILTHLYLFTIFYQIQHFNNFILLIILQFILAPHNNKKT